MIGSRKAVVVLTVGLLAGAALAGCLEDSSQGGSPGAGNASDTGTDAGGLDKSTLQETVRDSVPMMTQDDEGDSEVPDRFSMEGRFENDSATVAFGILLDKPGKLMILSMDMAGLSNQAGATSSTPKKGTFIMGQHGKVTVFGFGNESGTNLAAWYNASAEPVDELETGDDSSAGGAGQGSSSPFQDLDPKSLMENVTQEMDGNASWSAERITHEGRPAVKAEIHKTEEGVTYDLTTIVWTDANRMAYLNGTIEADDPSALDEGVSEGTFEVDFSYGDQASNQHEQEVVRAASLAFKDEEDLSAFGTGDAKTENYTIKPTPVDGVVPLEEATAIVQGSSGFGSSSGDPLRMPLEEGSASNGKVSVAFDDADGDDLVSPGDELTLTALGDGSASSYSLTLLDEKTGVKVSPGAPAAALLAAVAGLALATRRRR